MKKTAYEIERNRSKLARDKRLNELKETYNQNLPEIKDLNTPSFWNDLYSEGKRLADQDGMTKDRIKTVVSYIPQGKARLLDIGAGLGFLEEFIGKNKDVELFANDFSQVSIIFLRKNFSGKFSLQSVYELKYKNNYFDVITVLEVMEHIPPSKAFSIFAKIHKILKKNGILILSVPMNEGLEGMKNNPNGHVRMYTEELIKAELEIAGFKIVESKVLYAFSSFYNFKKFLSFFLKKWKPNNIVVKACKYG